MQKICGTEPTYSVPTGKGKVCRLFTSIRHSIWTASPHLWPEVGRAASVLKQSNIYNNINQVPVPYRFRYLLYLYVGRVLLINLRRSWILVTKARRSWRKWIHGTGTRTLIKMYLCLKKVHRRYFKKWPASGSGWGNKCRFMRIRI